jgi:hypothetical protein
VIVKTLASACACLLLEIRWHKARRAAAPSKARCYWEHPWGTHWEHMEYIENLIGTHLELEGNMLGTKGKWKNPPPLTQNFKEKKWRHFECMLSLPIGCMKFLYPKLFITIFGLG